MPLQTRSSGISVIIFDEQGRYTRDCAEILLYYNTILWMEKNLLTILKSNKDDNNSINNDMKR